MKLKSIFFLMILCIFLACQQSKTTKKDITFKINLGGEPTSLDPQLIDDNIGARMVEQMFLGLTTGDSKTGGYKPGLAEKWDISSDGKTYTFHLRDNLVWSDGVPITAEEIQKSYLRILDKETASSYVDIVKSEIENAEEYFNGKVYEDKLGIKALDSKTLEMTLVSPKPYFLDLLVHQTFIPVPVHIIETYGKEWTRSENMVTSGSYKLKERVPNEKVVLEKNENYYDAKNVAVNEIVFFTTDNATTAYNMYQNGELDAVFNNISPDLIQELKLRDDYYSHELLSSSYYIFNTKVKPFNDARVRKALTLAIDRELLTSKVLDNGSVPTRSISPNFNNYSYGKKLALFDIENAKKLLAEAGYQNGERFPKIVIKYNTSLSNKKIAEFLQNQWKENLNIDTDLQNKEWTTYLAERKSGNFVIARGGWIGDYADPLSFLSIYTTPNAQFSSPGYSNLEYDALIEKSNLERDPAKRQEILRNAEYIIVEKEFPVSPLYINAGNYLFRKDKWTGWNPNISERWTFANLQPLK